MSERLTGLVEQLKGQHKPIILIDKHEPYREQQDQFNLMYEFGHRGCEDFLNFEYNVDIHHFTQTVLDKNTNKQVTRYGLVLDFGNHKTKAELAKDITKLRDALNNDDMKLHVRLVSRIADEDGFNPIYEEFLQSLDQAIPNLR
jgi:hypothetical protein